MLFFTNDVFSARINFIFRVIFKSRSDAITEMSQELALRVTAVLCKLVVNVFFFFVVVLE